MLMRHLEFDEITLWLIPGFLSIRFRRRDRNREQAPL